MKNRLEGVIKDLFRFNTGEPIKIPAFQKIEINNDLYSNDINEIFIPIKESQKFQLLDLEKLSEVIEKYGDFTFQLENSGFRLEFKEPLTRLNEND